MIQSKFLEAMKETLTRKLDRKRASPTESAVMRESVKGTLWSWYIEAVLPEGDDPVPEYVIIFRDFFFAYNEPKSWNIKHS